MVLNGESSPKTVDLQKKKSNFFLLKAMPAVPKSRQ